LTRSKKSAHKTTQISLNIDKIKARKFKSFTISLTTNFFFISTAKAAMHTS